MALLGIQEILNDPDFTDAVTLIRRAATVNSSGVNVLTETSASVRMCVQGVNVEDLKRLPDAAQVSNLVTVYYAGSLIAADSGFYADIIVWRGHRYQVKTIVGDFVNFSGGYTQAICAMVAINE